MTDVLELFSGIGVIIDDAFGREEDDIIKDIKKSFEDAHVPIITYSELPDDDVTQNLKNASFIILDWNLLEEKIKVSDVIIKNNIDFIQKVCTQAFLPFFIFSNEEPRDIILKLEEVNLYDSGKSNFIFVKRKDDLKEASQLFTEIENWLKETPSIYVLKEWEYYMAKAKLNLFKDFNDIYTNWAEVLQKSYKEDGVDPDNELNGFIYKSLFARTSKIKFDQEIINNKKEDVSSEDLRKLLECERFLTKDVLSNKPALGDIFRTTEREQIKYLINIRPDCDIIRGSNSVKLYCLSGKVVDESKINSNQNDQIFFQNGELLEKNNNCYVAFIDDGKIIEFKLREIKIETWSKLKAQRIGRLLPPYITKLQQKHSFYLQRQGLPAIPEEAINESHDPSI
ncbi:MAG TPA: hypothetical protein GXZ40_00975 [Bacteroidales bacterium]|jgi:hypothetical protein|nr:hypothetical protein [Bacteroidales bacterium]